MEWIKEIFKDVFRVLLAAAIGLPVGYLILSLAYKTPLGPHLKGFVAYLGNFNELIVAMLVMIIISVVVFVGFSIYNLFISWANLLIKHRSAPPEEVDQ